MTTNMPAVFQQFLDRIGPLVAALDSTKLKAVEDNVETSWIELISFQQTQAAMHAAGFLKLDEAQWLYAKLGGENPTVEKWNALPLTERILITQTMTELLGVKITLRAKGTRQ